MSNLSQQSHDLLAEQTRSWETLRRNSELLERCESKTFRFDDSFEVITQFNAARIGSVSAKVDEESIRSRKCFLCDANRPPEQRSLDCGNGYKVLCNPFPIVPEHLTLVHEEHRPQRILDAIGDMLDLSKSLAPRYIVFYNGPECGASAPDHLHFQAGAKGSLPADREYDRLKRPVRHRSDAIRAFVSPDNYLRRFLAFESTARGRLVEAFERLHQSLHKLQPRAIEPMMNVFCSFEDASGLYRLILFPRHTHRPACFYATDDTRMMISPGSVDIAGLIVMPVEDDFRRVSSEDVVTTYREVTLREETFQQLVRTLEEPV